HGRFRRRAYRAPVALRLATSLTIGALIMKYQAQTAPRHPPGDHSTAASGVRKDPVCGMTVSADSPHRATHGGSEYFFCGAGCKKKFEADPERYLRVSGAPAPSALPSQKNNQAPYTCPMHPEVRQ